MATLVKAIRPYTHPGNLNFKQSVYEAWKDTGGQIAYSHYPPRIAHGLAYKYEIPEIKWLSRRCTKQYAYLMFVEPISLYFDTFPYYATHDIIPMFWDCWPRYYDKVERWLRKHGIKTAVFTSSQEMAEIKRRIPDLRVFHCLEAVDTRLYGPGKELEEREIDILEFGRSNNKIINTQELETTEINGETLNHIVTKQGGVFIFSNNELTEAMGNAKVTICLPKNITHPQLACNIETLTQRYWEAMLSRMVIIGHAPKELVTLIGYNPVIEFSFNSSVSLHNQVINVLEHIENYQQLVDKNRDTALRFGDWKCRINTLKEHIKSVGYKIQ